ncbi:MAG: hypothetical protein JO112_14465 [Planctomycetes bacterium]|nr:hypothetical protein [Planctomycetota bacterium]
MVSHVEQALTELRDLGSVAQMEALAGDGVGTPRLKVNAHLHLPPNFSAFQSVPELVDLAARQEIGVLGVSNYYDYEVYGDFARLARQQRIFPLFGLEIICRVEDLVEKGVRINDPTNPGKFYLCGKGITRFARMTPEAHCILDLIRHNDSTRMARVVSMLTEVFGERGLPTGLDEEAVIDMVVKRHGCPRERVYLQERHVCQAFQERVFELVPPGQRLEKLARVLGTAPKTGPEDAVQIQNDIRAHLLKAGKPAYVAETFIGFDDAYRLIVELGGILCYPTLGDGAKPICEFEEPVEELIGRIQERHIGCAEFIPVRNQPEVLRKYVTAMRAAGLVITAGTEHNTLEMLPLEPTCAGGRPIPEDLKAIFWEGACVVAAHQFLTLHGRQGFVVGCGQERIEALRRLGAAVIRQYQRR